MAKTQSSNLCTTNEYEPELASTARDEIDPEQQAD